MARRKPLSELSPAYRRRIEAAERKGYDRARARGHVSHEAERVEKKRRRYEREAARYVYDKAASGSTRSRPSLETLERGFKAVPLAAPEALRLDRDEIMRRAAMTYEELLLEFPEFENDEELNPYWYHACATSYSSAA